MIESSLFCGVSNPESKWFMQLYPNAIKQRTISCDVHNFVLSEGWGYEKYASREYIFRKNNDVLSQEKLMIFCELELLSDLVIRSGQNTQKYKIHECRLSNDLSLLLNRDKFSDVTLVVGEHEFLAHKNILSARSEVFAAMFEHDMEEQQSNRVVITDVDHLVLQEMLRFIYTGESPNLAKMANHLFAAADKYALEPLKALSEEALFYALSIETVPETLALAVLHSADRLKEKTIEFFKTHSKDIVKTNEWKNLVKTNPNVLAEAFGSLFT
ncbi:protein roadkill-like [Episyrphus balteatus]|uniref:protein roadkill-like n=1 Tax=Episyrphus balteatus TaxID=286459 RepID=UPI002486B558|nr:protein roadkill-like [Episyrphus balteatus]